MRPPLSLREGLEELYAMQMAPPCPATSVEFNGARMVCMYRQGHPDLHSDGCVGWHDPHGKVDFDFYSYWRKGRKKWLNKERLRIYLTARGQRGRLTT